MIGPGTGAPSAAGPVAAEPAESGRPASDGPEPSASGGPAPGRPDPSPLAGGPPIRVLVADDQRVVRDGLEMLLGLMPGVQVVGCASDGDEAFALTRSLLPDVVLMDLRMPGCDGVEATRRLAERHPDVRVVVLTTYADDRSVLDALRAGARGFLTKDAGADDIERALRRVVDGYAAIDPAVAHHLVDAISAMDRPEPPAASPAAPASCALPGGLTQRQAEVLGLIADGLSNTEIAARLFISETTVKTHINHLLTKLDLRDRAQAVGYAYRHGLARPDR
ncbi:response regulator [Rugosimonospora africana]|uniref:DNA-binding response regulator n=1 Tax=Rugosimonospora africana TaxID=556532 RepID=A0A8J3QTN3_9ACTN|nr:response regulator transcription factor [Rugosimonospora africana]GIH15772.1 DNA-binding response regulator [Rugosimonospora africana]